MAHDGLVSEPIEVGKADSPSKRIHRTAEEKRRIVEATLVADASIARVARENGVNANGFPVDVRGPQRCWLG